MLKLPVELPEARAASCSKEPLEVEALLSGEASPSRLEGLCLSSASDASEESSDGGDCVFVEAALLHGGSGSRQHLESLRRQRRAQQLQREWCLAQLQAVAGGEREKAREGRSLDGSLARQSRAVEVQNAERRQTRRQPEGLSSRLSSAVPPGGVEDKEETWMMNSSLRFSEIGSSLGVSSALDAPRCLPDSSGAAGAAASGVGPLPFLPSVLQSGVGIETPNASDEQRQALQLSLHADCNLRSWELLASDPLTLAPPLARDAPPLSLLPEEEQPTASPREAEPPCLRQKETERKREKEKAMGATERRGSLRGNRAAAGVKSRKNAQLAALAVEEDASSAEPPSAGEGERFSMVLGEVELKRDFARALPKEQDALRLFVGFSPADYEQGEAQEGMVEEEECFSFASRRQSGCLFLLHQRVPLPDACCSSLLEAEAGGDRLIRFLLTERVKAASGSVSPRLSAVAAALDWRFALPPSLRAVAGAAASLLHLLKRAVEGLSAARASALSRAAVRVAVDLRSASVASLASTNGKPPAASVVGFRLGRPVGVLHLSFDEQLLRLALQRWFAVSPPAASSRIPRPTRRRRRSRLRGVDSPWQSAESQFEEGDSADDEETLERLLPARPPTPHSSSVSRKSHVLILLEGATLQQEFSLQEGWRLHFACKFSREDRRRSEGVPLQALSGGLSFFSLLSEEPFWSSLASWPSQVLREGAPRRLVVEAWLSRELPDLLRLGNKCTSNSGGKALECVGLWRSAALPESLPSAAVANADVEGSLLQEALAVRFSLPSMPCRVGVQRLRVLVGSAASLSALVQRVRVNGAPLFATPRRPSGAGPFGEEKGSLVDQTPQPLEEPRPKSPPFRSHSESLCASRRASLRRRPSDAFSGKVCQEDRDEAHAPLPTTLAAVHRRLLKENVAASRLFPSKAFDDPSSFFSPQ